jgi:lysophospholipase L1-like esterase
MNRKVIFSEIAKGLGATLLVFAILETLLRLAYSARNLMVTEVPLPYVFGYDYGPIPPWLDGLRILEADKTLIWKNRPNIHRRYVDVFSPAHTEQERTALLRQFFPRFQDSLKGNPTWEISLNSEGFRDVEFRKQKPSSVFRIICLGDSWTFGWNVGQYQAYPQVLKALVGREFSEANFEIFNFGVGGYTSLNGLRLLKTIVLDLNPDVVVIGFAMNEPAMPGFRDKTTPNGEESVTLLTTLSGMVNKSEFFQLLRYWALLLKWQPESIDRHIEKMSRHATWKRQVVDDDFDEFEPWMRGSLRDFDKNHREMIKLARSHNTNIVLLYNEFWADSPYLKMLRRISREERVPLVDSSALISEAQRRIEEDLERKLDLQTDKPQRTNADGQVEVVFRVFADNWSVPTTMYIAGNHPQLGNLVPNKIAMYDDGTHGDQRAGDHVWSYSATFPQGTKLFYVYTNSGEEGKWEGLDVPHIRRVTVEAKTGEEKPYRPIESFGKIYMHADPWHTNAVGYELIARALLATLKKNEQVKDYLRRAKSKPLTSSHDR